MVLWAVLRLVLVLLLGAVGYAVVRVTRRRAEFARGDTDGVRVGRKAAASASGGAATAAAAAAAAEGSAAAERAADDFDYVIVGGGNAGCVLATDLARALPEAKVLLLEAGGQDDNKFVHIPNAAFLTQMPDAEMDYGYFSTPQPHTRGRRHHMPRARMLGGCTTMNFMLYVRGHPEDYDRWERDFGCRGWSYQDLLPIFQRQETALSPDLAKDSKAHGSSGPWKISRTVAEDRNPLSNAFVSACQALGLTLNNDYNGGDTRGVCYSQITVDDLGERHNAARAFLNSAALKDLPNLTIRTRAHVTRVLFSAAKRAEAVEFVNDAPGASDKGQTFVVRAKREVVLCGGSINSPQTLMLSGVGPADHLRAVGVEDVVADVPGVGQNLQDHLFVGCSREVLRKGVSQDAHYMEAPSVVADYLLRGRGPLASQGVEAMAFLDSSLPPERRNAPSSDVPDMQVHFFPRGGRGPVDKRGDPTKPSSRLLFNIPDELMDHEDGCTILPTLLYPKSRGTVTLSSLDSRAHPVIDPHYLEHEDDLELLAGGLEWAERCANQRAFNDLCAGGRICSPLNPPEKIDETDPAGPGAKASSAAAMSAAALAHAQARKKEAKHIAAGTRPEAFGPVGAAAAGAAAAGGEDPRPRTDVPDYDDTTKPLTPEGRREYVRQTAINVYHYAGTCRMGDASVADAVVDPELRVRGVTNLRVADCSIMPLIVGANTQAAAAVIGGKAADIIIAAHKAGTNL